MIQVAIIPGPKKPVDLFSFLNPLLSEMKVLSEQGMEVVAGGQTICAKVHLLFATGDIPAVSDLIFHKGHNSVHGCRFCTVKGVSKNGYGKYFQDVGESRSIDAFRFGDPVFSCHVPIIVLNHLLTLLGTQHNAGDTIRSTEILPWHFVFWMGRDALLGVQHRNTNIQDSFLRV